MKRVSLTLLSLFCLLLFATFASADTVYLKDGSIIKGKIVNETEFYIEILIEKEGIRASTKIAKDKIARIERDEVAPSAEPSATNSIPPSEEPKDSLEQAKKSATEALEAYEKKDYDKYLRAIVRLMGNVATAANFKEAYASVETPLKKNLPELLEEEIKRSCNAVPHVAAFKRLCPACSGRKYVTKIIKEKETKVACSTCKGTGGVDCETCKTRTDLAKQWRKKVRYTEQEMTGIAYLQVIYGDVARPVLDAAIGKLISSEKVYILEEEEASKKMEIRLRKGTVDEFADRLNASGLKITRLTTQKNTFIVKYK
ncbi:MAG: hypothetical protein WC712_00080 [Candidatus Brocadiia bacterium]